MKDIIWHPNFISKYISECFCGEKCHSIYLLLGAF